MGETTDPRPASIDSLIQWLRAERRRDPESPLADLLRGRPLEENQLVDIVCIDLMQRRRMSHPVQVEDYLDEYPALCTKSNLLDLIDAEVCVSVELGAKVDVEVLSRRFPDLADPIRELVQIDFADEKAAPTTGAGNSIVPDHGDGDTEGTMLIDTDRVNSHSGDFSIDELPFAAEPALPVTPLTPYPVDVPEWFIGDRCVASGPGRWLIRGRDSVRGIPLALKISELPVQVSEAEIEQVLDACERAASVRNPCWVRPSVAAIQHRHLGVVRPWLFARSFQSHRADQAPRVQLVDLSRVAFAVAAAHHAQATHGGIHSDNLMVDHDGKIHLIDGASSRIALERWLTAGNSRQIASLSARMNMDVQDLIKLVAAASVDWHASWSVDLLARLREIGSNRSDEACGLIGQTLIRCADSLPSLVEDVARPPLRERFATWIRGQ